MPKIALIFVLMVLPSASAGAIGPATATAVFEVVTCPEDANVTPVLSAGHLIETEGRLDPSLVRWQGGAARVFHGELVYDGTWLRARFSTPHCAGDGFELAVLPGHTRHYSAILETLHPRGIPGVTVHDNNLVVAGEIPLRGFTACLTLSGGAIVEDGAYYFAASRGEKLTFVLMNPDHRQSYSRFNMDLSNASPYHLFRRDISLRDLLDNSEEAVRARTGPQKWAGCEPSRARSTESL
jgi:hypothetical protein